MSAGTNLVWEPWGPMVLLSERQFQMGMWVAMERSTGRMGMTGMWLQNGWLILLSYMPMK